MTAEKLEHNVLEFWFGESPATADSVQARSKYWFKADDNFDDEIRERFSVDVDQAIDGQCRLDVQNAHQALALVILLDQFPRNIFRRSAKAFAGDVRSLAMTREAIASGLDKSLGAVECSFLFMPFQHAESLADQDEGVTRFAELAQRAEDWEKSMVESFHNYAGLHRDVVRQFGRFPHRNSTLDRDNTPEEQAYLDGSGRRFGQ